MAPKEIVVALGRISKVVALTRRRVLWVGLLGKKFREGPSSLLMLILLEGGGDIAVGCSTGGVR